jgi:hypothetical protein
MRRPNKGSTLESTRNLENVKVGFASIARVTRQTRNWVHCPKTQFVSTVFARVNGSITASPAILYVSERGWPTLCANQMRIAALASAASRSPKLQKLGELNFDKRAHVHFHRVKNAAGFPVNVGINRQVQPGFRCFSHAKSIHTASVCFCVLTHTSVLLRPRVTAASCSTLENVKVGFAAIDGQRRSQDQSENGLKFILASLVEHGVRPYTTRFS